MRHQRFTILTSCAVVLLMLLWTRPTEADPITGSGTTGAISKFTGPNSIGDSVIYESGGNVGIGTTTPYYGAKLDVAGGTHSMVRTYGPGNPHFCVISTDNNVYTKLQSVAGVNWGVVGTNSNHWFVIYTNNAGRMWFDTNGNVGVGCYPGSQKLEVNGTLYSKSGGFKFPDGTVQTTAATGSGGGGWVDSGTNVTLATSTDKVGIGTSSPSRTLTVRGNILIERSAGTAVMELGDGLDYAEGFDVAGSDKPQPGTVLVIDLSHPGRLTPSTKAYDTAVAGIAAGANNLGSGVRLGVGDFDCDVSLAGRVYCNVDATECGVQPGDLLTTSNVAGYAMKATDRARTSGAVLGKAMQSLEQGQKGQILVLVTLQ